MLRRDAVNKLYSVKQIESKREINNTFKKDALLIKNKQGDTKKIG